MDVHLLHGNWRTCKCTEVAFIFGHLFSIFIFLCMCEQQIFFQCSLKEETFIFMHIVGSQN